MTNNYKPIDEKTNHILKTIQLGSIEVPQYNESINVSGWINFGNDNLYPEYLVSLSNRSARHSAILKGKANMIGGNGWNKSILGSDSINFLKNLRNELDLDEILARVAFDYELFGAFALNIVWSKDRTSIAEINYINPLTLRIATPDPQSEYPDRQNYFISEDWKNWRKNQPIYYPGFSVIDRKEASQILYVKQYQSGGNNYYGVPSWISCVNFCELDYELSVYHLQTVKKGFHPSLIINFNMTPSDEEADQVVQNLKRQYQGAHNAGEVILTFSDGVDNAPKVTPINQTGNEAMFKDLSDTIETNIFQAHNITNPALFGVFQTGKLDNTSNLVESLAIFQSMYITHKQTVIEKVISKLAGINNISDKLMIERYNLKLTPVLETKDIMMVLDSTITNAQKQAVFESLGYSREEALRLIPADAPTPQQPVKVSPTTVVPKP